MGAEESVENSPLVLSLNVFKKNIIYLKISRAYFDEFFAVPKRQVALVIVARMEEKSKEFVSQGAEVYSQA